MNYKVKENKKSWTIGTKQGNVTLTLNVSKTVCPTRKDLEDHFKMTKYSIGGDGDKCKL